MNNLGTTTTVSIVILTYKSEDYIAQCLTSIARSDNGDKHEIIIVDNASSDLSTTVANQTIKALGLTRAKVVPLPKNLGCASGNNAGWRAATGDIILFLNPDTEITASFVAEITNPLINDPEAAVTGAKIYYPNSRVLQHAGAYIHPNGMTGHYGVGETDDQELYNEIRPCDYVTGAGFAVTRKALEELNGFDEEYFPAYFEETDFCTRVRKILHKKVLYIPTAILYHHESVTLAVDSPAFRRLYQKMRIMYLCKNLRTLREWRKAIGFEKWWMLKSPHSRGHRTEQFRAYYEAAVQLIKNKFTHSA
ncbi:glycosyltransferase family 2 protein [Candidatus Sumerlaeota bacterium]|nr:glycosyltransferase family 2 protein [Candidatus Sumerlaeota bacterium]